ncbi:hypothetical protein LCGC14_0143480 [marine sediment metagenome]|uniref:Uncharacterized protein n=1 Tax=marine sediment metagenome TaxID=412755 RepID=A0A0F9V3U5_9ZZZZ
MFGIFKKNKALTESLAIATTIAQTQILIGLPIDFYDSHFNTEFTNGYIFGLLQASYETTEKKDNQRKKLKHIENGYDVLFDNCSPIFFRSALSSLNNSDEFQEGQHAGVRDFVEFKNKTLARPTRLKNYLDTLAN